MRFVKLTLTALIGATLAAPAAAKPRHAPPPPVPEVLASFDQSAGESPEDVYLDPWGNTYVVLSLSGEVRKIAADGTQSTYAQLPIGTPFEFCSGFYSLAGPITFDLFGNMFISVGACGPVNRGVWRVPPGGGTPIQVVQLPDDSFPNGNVLMGGKLYVADSNLATIWEINPYSSAAEGNAAEVWAQSPLIERNVAGAGFPGANGIQRFRRSFYVAATDKATIVEFPILRDGTSGSPSVYAETGVGCDDMAFDFFGNLYCASFFDTVLRIDKHGDVETVLEGGDLDGPTSVAFGRTWDDFLEIYVTNGSFPGFSAKNTPTLMRYRVGVPGAIPY